MTGRDLLPPPEVFSLPVFLCPSCRHGIDPHGLGPGDICGVGDESGYRCQCFWSPNDIAATWASDLRAEINARRLETWDEYRSHDYPGESRRKAELSTYAWALQEVLDLIDRVK